MRMFKVKARKGPNDYKLFSVREDCVKWKSVRMYVKIIQTTILVDKMADDSTDLISEDIIGLFVDRTDELYDFACTVFDDLHGELCEMIDVSEFVDFLVDFTNFVKKYVFRYLIKSNTPEDDEEVDVSDEGRKFQDEIFEMEVGLSELSKTSIFDILNAPAVDIFYVIGSFKDGYKKKEITEEDYYNQKSSSSLSDFLND